MGNIHVRNVADATKAELKKKAKTAGKSFNDVALEPLEAAAKPSKAKIWAAADRIREMIRARIGHDFPDSTSGIREDRDRR
jgi:plasmid stability protein